MSEARISCCIVKIGLVRVRTSMIVVDEMTAERTRPSTLWNALVAYLGDMRTTCVVPEFN